MDEPTWVASVLAKPAAAPAPPAGPSISDALLAVVADKTGYPKDMIGLDMEIEADLGIDSIKRVEILSAVQETIPSLPVIPAAELGAMRTLRNILERFGASVAPVAPMTDAPAAPPVPVPVPGEAPQGGASIESVLLSVVADKTGYPKDMIGLDMEIEADLGIDSIKRVEILSAVQEQLPALPAIPAAELGSIRTLRQILERLGGAADAIQAPAASRSSPAATSGPAPAPVAALVPTRLGRFVAVRRPSPRPGFSPRGLFSGVVLIVRDANGIADQLVSILKARGVMAEAVDTADEAPRDAVPRSSARIIDLSALSDGQSAYEGIRIQKEIFEGARAVARSTDAPRLFIAVADLFGAAAHSPWTGGVQGLIRTMALELPDVASRFISIAKGRVEPDRLAQILAAEILEGGADLEIAIDSAGNRTAPFYEDAPAPGPVTEGAGGKLEDGSVLLVSGGARGVTATCLEELSGTGVYRIAILGRTDADLAPSWAQGRMSEPELQAGFIEAEKSLGHTATPAEARQAAASVAAARETRAALESLRSRGSTTLYLPCDIKDEGDVMMAVNTIRSHFGRIDGLIHAAGVLADKRIAEKSLAQFNSVFDTKVAGLHHLLQATEGDDLKVLCFFGSVAGRVGNPGQADYAMANETLESVAQHEAARRKHARVRVLHWGPWDGGMVTPSLRSVFKERGVPLIPIADGARIFVEAINDPSAPVSMVVGGRPAASILLGPGAARKVAGDLVVSSRTSPHLASHAVKGVPVFPVALALEAFARIARSTRPDLRLSAIKDLRVLKGIRIENFEAQGTRLEISCEQVSNGSGAELSCELRSPGGPVHYRARAVMTDRRSPKASPQEFEAPKSGAPWATEDVYGPVLFHGPDFQVLKGVGSVGPQGGSALVASTRDIGWMGGPFATDPAAIDGGLQMAILMGMRAVGRTSLPTGVESLTIHIDEPTNGPLHCSIRSRSVSDFKTVSDAIVRTNDGRLLCELRGIEMHMVDTTAQA
jgi:NAD(P)-dependent dehydrogenase (short-subunit alcohol dehydrogenase family)/acyl carrier protein